MTYQYEDYDQDYSSPVGPRVECPSCNLDIGEHPAGTYAECDECGAAYLAQWPEPEYEPSEEDIAAYDAARAATLEEEHRAMDAREEITLPENADG